MEDEVSDTDTEATGPAAAFETDTGICPEIVPLIAMIVALPVDTAVATPACDIATTDAFELCQEIGAPAMTAPAASRAVALACAVCPSVRLDLFSTTAIDATGPPPVVEDTVKPIVPCLPSLLTVIVAEPLPTPVHVPLADTEAIVALDVLHVIVRPERTLPAASFNVTEIGAVAPTVRLVVGADNVMEATGAGAVALIVTVADAVLPSDVATIVAVPAATPDTRPDVLTVANVGSLLDHVTARFDRMLPLASRRIA